MAYDDEGMFGARPGRGYLEDESDWDAWMRAVRAGGFPGSIPNPDYNPPGTATASASNALIELDPNAIADKTQFTSNPNIRQINGKYYIPSNLLRTSPQYTEYGEIGTWHDILKYPVALGAMAFGGGAISGAEAGGAAAGGSAFPAGSAAAVEGGTVAGGASTGTLAGGADTLATMSAESAAADASYATTAESMTASGVNAPAGYTPTLADVATGASTESTVYDQAGDYNMGGDTVSGGIGTDTLPGGGGLGVDILGNPITPESLLRSIPASVWAGGLQAVLGYLGAGQQADAYSGVAAQNLAIGAPYRDRLNASYGPDFNLMNQPGYGDAFDRMADISTRQWSTKGNPANNPGIQGGILSDVWNQSYIPAMSNYRGQLGQFGGLGLNTAGSAQLGGAQTAGGGLDAIGYGLGTALNPQPDWNKIFGGNLNVGGTPYGGRR